MNLNQLAEIGAIFAAPSWDILIPFIIAAAIFFYGASSGKERIIAFVMSLYIGGFVFEHFSYLNKIIVTTNPKEQFLFGLFLFFIIILALNAILLNAMENSVSPERRWWQVLILSVFSAGLLFSFSFKFFGIQEAFNFSPSTLAIFASPNALFWWLLLPVAGLILVRD
jgi:hypothetical protein